MPCSRLCLGVTPASPAATVVWLAAAPRDWHLRHVHAHGVPTVQSPTPSPTLPIRTFVLLQLSGRSPRGRTSAGRTSAGRCCTWREVTASRWQVVPYHVVSLAAQFWARFTACRSRPTCRKVRDLCAAPVMPAPVAAVQQLVIACNVSLALVKLSAWANTLASTCNQHSSTRSDVTNVARVTALSHSLTVLTPPPPFVTCLASSACLQPNRDRLHSCLLEPATYSLCLPQVLSLASRAQLSSSCSLAKGVP
jgi:hypothetical protein